MAGDLKAQLEIGADASGVEAGVSKAKRSLADLGVAAATAGKQASQGLSTAGDGGGQAAGKIDQATKSIIGSIQRTTAALDAGSRTSSNYFKVLAEQRGADPAALKPYLDALDAVNARQKSVGVSAAQTAAAMRTVPAQFTDILTQLQGGGNPLTILLQQGGQLKDSFGGVGAAARALGGYVAGLVGPVTLAGGAVLALVAGYARGSMEADAYAKSLILTGNAAGTTAGRLADAARRIDGVVGTQSKAAEVLSELAGASNIDPAGLERFATAAIRMERATGQAASETIKQLSEIGKAPLEASVKLNDSTNFLTESTYRQIKALTEAGRTAEAAAVAQRAYADSLEQRGGQIEARLGLIERGWRGIKDAAKEAWDAMLSIGRADTLADQLAAAEAQLAAAGASRRGADPTRSDARREAMRERVEALREQVRLEGHAATLAGESARQVKARIEFDKAGEQFLSDEAKLQREINKAREQGVAAGASQAEIEQRIADIRAKASKGRGTAADPFAAERDAAKSWADAWTDFGRIAADAQAKTDGLTKGQARLVEYLQSPAYANASEPMRKLALQQAYAAISAEQHAEQVKADADALKQATAESDRYVSTLQRSAATVEDQARKLEDEGAAARLAAAENITLAKAVERITVARLREAQAIELSYGNDTAAEAIQREIDARARLAAAMDDKDARAAADKLRQSEAREWEKVWDQVGQSFTDALMDGGRSAKKLLEDLFRTLILRPLVQPLIGSVASLFGGPASASGASPLSSLSSLGQLSGLGGLGSIFKAGATMALNGGTAASLQGSLAMLQSGQYGAGLLQGAGTLAPWALGAAAGGMLGRSISGGYALSGSGNGLVNIGTVAGAIFGGPIGAAIGGSIGGLINRAFGRKTTDSGIEGTLGGAAGFAGGTFEFQKGGWFSSSRTVRGALDADTAQALQDAVSLTRSATKDYAAALGLGAGSVDSYTQAIKISLRGLSAEQQQQAITDALAKFADGIAASLGGGLDRLSLKGETSATTLARLASNISAVNSVLDSLNTQLLATSVSGADAAGKLLEAFGGVDAFAGATSTYLQDFYGASDRAAITTRQLTTQFGKLGLALPTTRDGYRQLVDAQDLMTDSGRKTYAALIGMSSAFATISQAAEDAALSTTGLADEIERLRGGGAADASIAGLQSRFAIATAQARAGSQDAIDSLPEISRSIEQASQASARSAADLAAVRASLASSLAETLAAVQGVVPAVEDQARAVTAITTSGALPEAQSSGSQSGNTLLAELQALRTEVAGLRADNNAGAASLATHARRTATYLERVIDGTDAMRTTPA